MMKRNDGYTLAYVVVVLAVLALVALSTMSLALLPQKSVHHSLERMQEKYAAQGVVEQVVAHLQQATDEDSIDAVIEVFTTGDPSPCSITEVPEHYNTYKLVSKADDTIVTVEFRLDPVKVDEKIPAEYDDDNNLKEGTGITVSHTVGHTVTYLSYATEVHP